MIYAIGDLQGCYDPLQRLLEVIRFDPAADTLWFVGDLVNRGPASLETLRFVRSLGERAVTVLGNHDLHLLAVAAGTEPLKKKDTLDEILRAPDREELIDWLRHRPLVHLDRGWLMVHAGVAPQWSAQRTRELAGELERVLRSGDAAEFFRHMYGDRPERWSDDLRGWDRLRCITNYLTRIRYCRPDGTLDLRSKGPPGTQGPGWLPWYAVPGRASRDTPILFGHWATLRLRGEDPTSHNVYHLDTGCVWGGALSALRLEDRRWFSVPA
ncbi:MAG: symmetrical bis(5'-nucleosyl)-tetraphosphatase [Gammaproteobacteria bacterium]|nr:MAG: symmetrical bis(5'-nucleosyl)-tetraphosphatase [Gammaproteobacteria bacterium]